RVVGGERRLVAVLIQPVERKGRVYVVAAAQREECPLYSVGRERISAVCRRAVERGYEVCAGLHRYFAEVHLDAVDSGADIQHYVAFPYRTEGYIRSDPVL